MGSAESEAHGEKRKANCSPEKTQKAEAVIHATASGAGLVWDSASAMKLRCEQLLVGASVGTLPGHRTQEQAHSLPVALWPEEVLHALEHCSCRLLRASSSFDPSSHPCPDPPPTRSAPPRARGLPAPRARSSGRGSGRASASASSSARRWGAEADSRCCLGPTSADMHSEPWQQLAARSEVEIPVHGINAVEVALDSLGWPHTEQQWARWAVFRDLKRRGYAITSGAKFGADYLAYPHDPALYHATFSVRLCLWDTPLHPLTLAAATRMSHAARKHVLLASARWDHDSVTEITEPKVDYIAVGPDVSLSSQRSFKAGMP